MANILRTQSFSPTLMSRRLPALLLACLLVGCGQKGPLKLPDPKASVAAPAATPAPR
jgi:predicted small lipoprotein YifL